MLKLFFVIFVSIAPSLAFNRDIVKSIDLKQFVDKEFLNELFSYKIDINGEHLYILNRNLLKIIDIETNKIVFSERLSFLDIFKNCRTYLIVSKNNVGILAYDKEEELATEREKKVSLFMLDKNYKVFSENKFTELSA